MPAKKSSTKKTTTKKNKKQLDNSLDERVKNINKNIDQIGASTKKGVESFVASADDLADNIDSIGEHVDAILDHVFPSRTGSEATFDVQWNVDVSRLFIFRSLWGIIQGPVFFVWGIWIMLITILHWVLMFINGKRNRDLRNRQVRFWRHQITWKIYFQGITNKRPPFITPA